MLAASAREDDKADLRGDHSATLDEHQPTVGGGNSGVPAENEPCCDYHVPTLSNGPEMVAALGHRPVSRNFRTGPGTIADVARYPRLDREDARRDASVFEQWEADVAAAYAEIVRSVPTFGPGGQETAPDDLGAFEQAARNDREWADGYRRGRADAHVERSGLLQGVGVMPDDPKDGWSASLTRQAGYALGLEDGRGL